MVTLQLQNLHKARNPIGFEVELKHKKTMVEHALWIGQWWVLNVLPGIPVSMELMVSSVSSVATETSVV